MLTFFERYYNYINMTTKIKNSYHSSPSRTFQTQRSRRVHSKLHPNPRSINQACLKIGYNKFFPLFGVIYYAITNHEYSPVLQLSGRLSQHNSDKNTIRSYHLQTILPARSLMQSKNNIGPSVHSWGTEMFDTALSETVLPTLINTKFPIHKVITKK